jgi:hypothetical protein
MRAAYRAGDLAGHLGWRPPIRTNARLEIVRGATGDPEPWMRLTGIEPSGLREALRREPCTVQERWFAHAAADNQPLPAEYHKLFWTWFVFGFPAFGAVLTIFWLMMAKPQLW